MIPGFLMAFLTFNWLLGGPTEHSAYVARVGGGGKASDPPSCVIIRESMGNFGLSAN